MRYQLIRIATVLLAAAASVPTAQAHPTAAPAVWEAVLTAAEGQDHLSAFPNGVAYAQYGVGVAKSADHGMTWQQLAGPPNSSGTSGIIRFATPTLGFGVTGVRGLLGDPTRTKRCGGELDLRRTWVDLWQTTDGGTSWLPGCGPLIPKGTSWGASPTGLFAARDGRTLLLAGTESEELGCDDVNRIRARAFLSPDRGRTWRSYAFPRRTTMSWFGGAVRDSRHAAALVETFTGSCSATNWTGSDVYVTADGGRTFRRVFHCPGTTNCTTVEVVSSRRIIVGLADGRTFFSNDGGRHFAAGQLLRSWYYEQAISRGALDPRLFWIQRFSFANDKVGYASTRGSGTWRTADGGMSWIQETSPECVYYPFGIGDIAAGGPDHGITGGPRNIDARVPATGPQLGCGTPPDQLPAVPAGAIAGRTRLLDGTAAEVTVTGFTTRRL